MTAAGTVPAARVLLIGVVAGLQAIATAKRLGAIVSATDVRAASRAGRKFRWKIFNCGAVRTMKLLVDMQKQDEYKKKQAEMMKKLSKKDIVICTALIPGKPAPRILTEELVKLMKPGLLFMI